MAMTVEEEKEFAEKMREVIERIIADIQTSGYFLLEENLGTVANAVRRVGKATLWATAAYLAILAAKEIRQRISQQSRSQ